MKNKAKYIYLILGVAFVGYYAYSSYYGKAVYEDKVQKNTEYTGNRVYGGYGNRFHHK